MECWYKHTVLPPTKHISFVIHYWQNIMGSYWITRRWDNSCSWRWSSWQYCSWRQSCCCSCCCLCCCRRCSGCCGCCCCFRWSRWQFCWCGCTCSCRYRYIGCKSKLIHWTLLAIYQNSVTPNPYIYVLWWILLRRSKTSNKKSS